MWSYYIIVCTWPTVSISNRTTSVPFRFCIIVEFTDPFSAFQASYHIWWNCKLQTSVSHHLPFVYFSIVKGASIIKRVCFHRLVYPLPPHTHIFLSGPRQNLDFQHHMSWFHFHVRLFELTGGCANCWYCCNWFV